MPLFSTPVVLPYILEGDTAGAVYPVTVQTVATAAPGALATAKVLVGGVAALRHPGHTVKVLTDRAKIGAIGAQVMGPYAYPLTRRGNLHHITFPTRIDGDQNQSFEGTFKGFDPALCFGVLMDCVHLAFINSTALGTLAAHAERVNLHIFRVPDGVLKVLAMVGFERLLPPHADLTVALAVLRQSPPLPTGLTAR